MGRHGEVDSFETESACRRLRKKFGVGTVGFSVNKRDIDLVCSHTETYDKDAVMIMLGYQFPTRRNFETAIEEYADKDNFGVGSAARIEYSLRMMAKEYEDYF